MPTRTLLAYAARAVVCIFAGGFLLWFAYTAWLEAYEGYLVQKYWYPLPGPYSAKVVGFPIGEGDHRSRKATVRITFPNRKTLDFSSSYLGGFSKGDEVRVLKSSNEVRLVIGGALIMRKFFDIYEIDDPELLWARNACYGAFFLIMAGVILAAGLGPVLALSKPGKNPGARLQAAGPSGEPPLAPPGDLRFEARFTPTAEDAVTAYRMARGQGEDYWRLHAFGGVLFAVVMGVAAFILKFPVLVVLGVLVGPFTFGVIWIRERQVGSTAEGVPSPEALYYFTETALEYRCGSVRATYPWATVKRTSLDDRGVLIYTAGAASFIPARAFPDGYFPRGELRSFLSSSLKNA